MTQYGFDTLFKKPPLSMEPSDEHGPLARSGVLHPHPHPYHPGEKLPTTCQYGLLVSGEICEAPPVAGYTLDGLPYVLCQRHDPALVPPPGEPPAEPQAEPPAVQRGKATVGIIVKRADGTIEDLGEYGATAHHEENA